MVNIIVNVEIYISLLLVIKVAMSALLSELKESFRRAFGEKDFNLRVRLSLSIKYTSENKYGDEDRDC